VRAAALGTLGALVATGCTGTSGGQVEVRAAPEPEQSTSTTAPPDCAETLPPAAQAGQLLMVMVTDPSLAAEPLAAGTVGGLGLKGRQSSDVGDQVAEVVAAAPVPPIVASDEEGGTVQRLDAALEPLPSAEELAEGTPADAGQLFAAYAASMVDLGFTMNFGPVADVGGGSDLGSRSFGDDPSEVASFTDAIIAAQEGAGLLSAVKHWPGIGGGSTDPHVSLDTLAPLDELRATDMVPFDRAIAAGTSAVMVAHAAVPGLTAEGEPASLSRAAITDELRGRQGFDGLVVTDSLGMGAIVNTVAQDDAAERAIAAGADLALLSGADLVPEAHARLTDAITSGRIPAEQVTASVRRVLSAKGIEGGCVDLVATYSSLLAAAPESDPDSADGSGTADDTDSAGTGEVTDSGINDTSGTG
jgi:beta-N-acetylhexosaminidase